MKYKAGEKIANIVNGELEISTIAEVNPDHDGGYYLVDTLGKLHNTYDTMLFEELFPIAQIKELRDMAVENFSYPANRASDVGNCIENEFNFVLKLFEKRSR